MTVYVAPHGSDRYEAGMALREAVLVDELGIPAESVFDGADGSATHLVTVDDGEVVGTLRFREPEPGTCRGERFVVAPSVRGDGRGVELVRGLLNEAAACGHDGVRVRARPVQVDLLSVLGFDPDGDPVEIAGIEHRPMRHDLYDCPTGRRPLDPPD